MDIESVGLQSPADELLVISVVAARDGAAELRLAGELDLATADLLVDAVEHLRRDGRRRVSLDLASLEFCDVAGLRAILTVQRRLRIDGGALAVIDPPRILRRLVSIAGLDTVLDLPRSLPQGAEV